MLVVFKKAGAKRPQLRRGYEPAPLPFVGLFLVDVFVVMVFRLAVKQLYRRQKPFVQVYVLPPHYVFRHVGSGNAKLALPK